MSIHRQRVMRVLAAAAAVAVGATMAATPAVAEPTTTLAPLLPAESGTPNGGYIVVLKNGSAGGGTARGTDPAVTAERAGGQEIRRYSTVLKGFSAKLRPGALAAVRANPNVAYVRADARFRAIEAAPTSGGGIGATQTNPPSWGLDRIDQRNLPLNQQFNYVTVGTGATVYIVDTGIRTTHTDFGTRAAWAYNAVNDSSGPTSGDCHGHGTHVAGTVGGTLYGVAKNAQIRDVRVLDCAGFGTNADLIEGMDWVADNAPARSIANFSLQNYGTEVNAAAENLIDAGVMTVFIGGNYNTDACSNNPTSTRGIKVGATWSDDSRWSSSNYGPCIDIFAPGSGITSAGHTGDTAVASGWSGTSMAAPHVAGWLARYLETNTTATLAQAKSALIAAATTNVLTNIGTGSPNRLLYADPGSPTPDTVAPTTPGTPVASNLTATSATLTWTASTDNVAVTGYELQRSVNGGSFSAAGTSSTNSINLTSLTANTAYQYRVRAVDAATNASSYSSAVSFTTPAAGNCEVAYTISSGGPNFTANIVIKNTGTTTINGWTLAFTLPSGHSFISGWSATWGGSGQNRTATSLSWNATLNPQNTATIGFNGNGTGTAEPTAFTLNGSSCTVV